MKTFAALFVVLSLLPIRPVFSQSPDLKPLRARATDSYREGRYEEAAALYRQILTKDPKNVDLLRDLMWVLWKSERFEEAQSVAELLLQLRKDDQEAKNIVEKAPTLALRSKANNHFHAGRYEQANKLYKKLAQQDPGNVSVLRDLMWSLWETGRYEEARGIAHRILNVRRNDAEAKEMVTRAPQAILRAKAVRDFRAGRYEQATQSYRRLLSYSPNNAGLLKDLYWATWQTGQYEKLLPVALQLTKAHPNDVEGWNLLGKSYMASSRPEEALAAYQRSLKMKPDQPDARRMIGRLFVDLREFDSAIDTLDDLEKMEGASPTIYPQIAKAQFFKGQYGESAQSWGKAVQLYPENDNYKIHEARALYYNKQYALALSKTRKIAAGSGPMRGLAIDFLADDALANNDPVGAEKVLEEFLKDMRPADEPRFQKLAAVYAENGKIGKSVRVLNRIIKANPGHQPALLQKADILYKSGRNGAAARAYQRVQKLNPYSIAARDGLANAQLAMGHRLKALATFNEALKLDPTNPYLIISQSHFLDASGHKRESEEVLLKWLKKNKGPVLPILLYHGLSPFQRDPMLAYPVHIKVSAFEDQMRALKTAGYTPVTTEQVVDWVYKNKALPKKPILIEFDDGRLDSFRYADPILKKHGLKATMHIIITNIEGNLPPSYASWSQIIGYRDSGRWEFQAHGDKGHNRIPIDAEGRQGLFLVNRQWLSDRKRLETVGEWKARVVADHKSAKRNILNRLGANPLSFAYPEGTYGQIDTVNSPHAVPLNLQITKDEYKLAYYQDRFGINVKSRDPMYFARLEPRPDWSGEDLVNHLENNDPSILMYRRLLWHATWDGRPRKAMGYLKNLKDAGASQLVLLGEEGRIRSALGEWDESRALAESAVREGKDRDNEKLLESVRTEQRPYWSPSYTFSEDKVNRRNSVFEQILRPVPHSKIDWGIVYLYGTYRERRVSKISQNAAGLRAWGKLSRYHSLGGRALWHWFPNSANVSNTYSGFLSLNSSWTDGLRTDLKGGRALYETTRALRAEVTEDFLDGTVQWRQDGPWELSSRLQGSELSDGNKRYGIEGTVSRDLMGNLSVLYKYTFDHMDKPVPNYYSPQQLHQHQLGLQLVTGNQKFQPTLRYLPGVGRERFTDNEFIQDVQASLAIRFNSRTSLYPSYSYFKTPTYWRNTYNIFLTHHF